MHSGVLHTNAPYQSVISLSQDDFNFVNHIFPRRFFRGPRPYHLINDRPFVKNYNDAIYIPATRSTRPFDGCLYDSERQRIDETCIKRERTDMMMNSNRQQYSGEVAGLPTHDEPLIYFGYINPHFGHFLIESLAYWWTAADRLSPDARYLVHIHDPSVLELPVVKACLAALQIDRSRLVYFDQPVILRHVSVPETSLQLDSHIFSKYRELTHKIAGAICTEGLATTEQPLYISRSKLRAGVTEYKNQEQIEQFLEKKGARIWHPQLHSFEEQVRILNEHKNIIGIMGSGMHNISFALEQKNVVYLTTHYVSPTTFLLDRCFNVNSTYFQASTITDKLKRSLAQYRPKAKPNGHVQKSQFIASRELNHVGVTKWLQRSGYC